MRPDGQHGGVEAARMLVGRRAARTRVGALVALRVEAERESGAASVGAVAVNVQAGAACVGDARRHRERPIDPVGAQAGKELGAPCLDVEIFAHSSPSGTRRGVATPLADL